MPTSTKSPLNTTTDKTTKACGIEIRRVADSGDTSGWLTAVAEEPYPALLESSLYSPEQGVWSILCWDPHKKITACGNENVVCNLRDHTSYSDGKNPFALISEEFEKDRIRDAADFPLPFAGGAIGYFSYDLRHRVESLPVRCEYDLPVPEYILCFYDKALIFDHKNNATFLVGNDVPDFKRLEQKQKNARKRRKSGKNILQGSGIRRLQSNVTPEEYIESVIKIKDYIAAGDIFQANLSQRFEGPCNEDATDIYRRLQIINSAPFSAFLRYPEFEIISSSPERFLLLDGENVMTRPIKGTRPRAEGRGAFNERMKRELSESEKDHAELTMIVDLERNDLGRVCSYGSVRVKEHASLETYPTVYHLVSTVTGRLHRARYSEFDLIRAAFPGGSITGTPKIRAMEIIEELEPAARNVYTGSIGYISRHGRMDLNILIRTMLKINGRLYMNFGGGVVADSDPLSEYKETIHKGNALFKAAGASNYAELIATAEP